MDHRRDIPFGGRPGWELSPAQRRIREEWMLREADRLVQARKNMVERPYIPGDESTYNPRNVEHVTAKARLLVEQLRGTAPAPAKVHRNDLPPPAPSMAPERQHVLSVAAQLTEALRRRDAGNDLR